MVAAEILSKGKKVCLIITGHATVLLQSAFHNAQHGKEPVNFAHMQKNGSV